MASPSTDQGAARAQVSVDPWWDNDDGDRVVGFFRSWNSCDDAGEYGEDRGWWEDYDCVRVRSGHQARRYALVVDDNDWGSGWHGNWQGHSFGQWWSGGNHGWNWWLNN